MRGLERRYSGEYRGLVFVGRLEVALGEPTGRGGGK